MRHLLVCLTVRFFVVLRLVSSCVLDRYIFSSFCVSSRLVSCPVCRSSFACGLLEFFFYLGGYLVAGSQAERQWRLSPPNFRIPTEKSTSMRVRHSLLVILGQFVSHFVSARISAYQRCIRNPDTSLLYQKKYVVSAMYHRCISDVSVNYVISS